MSLSHRTELVRAFRAMLDPPKRKQDWSALIKKTEASVGLLPANDIHSILVSVSKSLSRFDIHPVRIAPLVFQLIERAIESPQTELRTKAGIFGLIPRIGIDWDKHVDATLRIECQFFFKTQFIQAAPMARLLVPQSIGYLCDAAVYIGVESEEFTKLVAENMTRNPGLFSPLVVVQIANYLSLQASQIDRKVWKCIASETLHQIDSFTPQNFVSLFQSFARAKVSSIDLVRNSLPVIIRSASRMRLNDCLSLLESVCLLGGRSQVPELTTFAKAIQRRIVVLYATAPPGVIHTQELARISESLQYAFLPHRDSVILIS